MKKTTEAEGSSRVTAEIVDEAIVRMLWSAYKQEDADFLVAAIEASKKYMDFFVSVLEDLAKRRQAGEITEEQMLGAISLAFVKLGIHIGALLRKGE